jgi:rhodanese-related sulfurtransferase
MISFFKKLFGLSAPEQPEIINTTSHPKPELHSLDGKTFRAAYDADENGVLLDVRTGLETQSGVIEDATHIDFMSLSFKKNAAELDKSKTYYVYCKAGGRSDGACMLMHHMGYDVRNLKGGKGAWPE